MDDRSVVLQPWTLVSKVILLPRTNVYFNDHYTCCLTMAVYTDDHRLSVHTASVRQHRLSPQWGAADAEIKIPSVENTELEGSPYKAWSRSVYGHTCYAYCQGFLSFLLISTLSVHSPAFFPKPLPIFPCVGCG